MRTRAVVALAVLLAAGPAACARAAAGDPQVASAAKGSAPTAGPSASASSSEDPDAPLKFSQCMREHGISWFPDPVDGKMSIAVPKGTDMKKMEAAQEACKKFMPNGGAGPKMTAEDLERARKMSQCMRENGVPNFPDPEPDGRLTIDGSKLGTGPGQPTFDKAEKACAKYVPEGAQKHSSSDGGKTAGMVG